MNRILHAIMLLLALLSSSAWAGGNLVNSKAPDFSIPPLMGAVDKLSHLKGQVVMLNFWASWCGPCREEMPLLESLHQKYKKLGFTVYGVNLDIKAKDALPLLKSAQVSFPVGHDKQSKVSELYKVDAMPSTLMLDRNGVIRYLHRGYEAGYEQKYEQQIRQLVRE